MHPHKLWAPNYYHWRGVMTEVHLVMPELRRYGRHGAFSLHLSGGYVRKVASLHLWFSRALLGVTPRPTAGSSQARRCNDRGRAQ
jgi:hypothetical protein